MWAVGEIKSFEAATRLTMPMMTMYGNPKVSLQVKRHLARIAALNDRG